MFNSNIYYLFLHCSYLLFFIFSFSAVSLYFYFTLATFFHFILDGKTKTHQQNVFENFLQLFLLLFSCCFFFSLQSYRLVLYMFMSMLGYVFRLFANKNRKIKTKLNCVFLMATITISATTLNLYS